VPLSLDQLDEAAARERVVQVLESTGVDWRQHLELKS
jgi:hypothetical protein